MWPSEPSSINCGPQGTFTFYLRPAEHFFMLMWPLSGFEFKTPGVELTSQYNKMGMTSSTKMVRETEIEQQIFFIDKNHTYQKQSFITGKSTTKYMKELNFN